MPQAAGPQYPWQDQPCLWDRQGIAGYAAAIRPLGHLRSHRPEPASVSLDCLRAVPLPDPAMRNIEIIGVFLKANETTPGIDASHPGSA